MKLVAQAFILSLAILFKKYFLAFLCWLLAIALGKIVSLLSRLRLVLVFNVLKRRSGGSEVYA